ncbi:hypothetical protein ACO03_11430 [Pantoea ananatis]|nr:hypothetical protein ACO03_11430 [Pantoea ananatis]
MKFIHWLISLFIHPKQETKTMSEPLNDTAVAVSVEKPAPVAQPVQEVKTGVKDFEAALKFVESGVSQLGAAAKDELKALAVKYL